MSNKKDQEQGTLKKDLRVPRKKLGEKQTGIKEFLIEKERIDKTRRDNAGKIDNFSYLISGLGYGFWINDRSLQYMFTDWYDKHSLIVPLLIKGDDSMGGLRRYTIVYIDPKYKDAPLSSAGIPQRRNIAALRDLPSLVEQELIKRTQLTNRTHWQNEDDAIEIYFPYYEPWDTRLWALKKPTAGYSLRVQRLGFGVAEGQIGNPKFWRAMCVGSAENRYTDIKLVAWYPNGEIYAQRVWLTSSWYKDLITDLGIGETKEVFNKETKEEKTVLVKNYFKQLQQDVQTQKQLNFANTASLEELQGQIKQLNTIVSSLDGQVKSLKTRIVEQDNNILKLKGGDK